jgi:YVTN family beta-propeller protein
MRLGRISRIKSIWKLGLFLPHLLAAAPVAAGSFAFVTNQTSSDLSVLDLDTRREIIRIPIPGSPAGVAVSGSIGSFFTVSPENKMVNRFSISTCEVEASIKLPGGPTGIAIAPDLGLAFVSDWYNARIFVLDAVTLTRVRDLKTGSAPAGLVVSDQNTWLASADRDANQISLFNLPDMSLRAHVPVGTRPFGISVDPSGRIHVANVGSDNVSVVDPELRQVVATVPVGARPYGIAFFEGLAFTTDQYADTVTVYNLSDFSRETVIDVGEYPEGIDSVHDRRTIVSTNWFSNTVSLIDARTRKVAGEIPTGDGPRAFGRFTLTLPPGKTPCQAD